MSYYAGDYYRRGGRGDYYRGDPFSLGNLVGGLLKGVGTVASVIPGVGAIAGPALIGAGNAISPPKLPSTSVFQGVTAGSFITPIAPGMSVPSGQVVKQPGIGGVISRILPGGETGYMIRRSRRMNVTNPRALRRAIRRVSGFGKLVQRSKRAIARANSAVGNKSRSSSRKRGR